MVATRHTSLAETIPKMLLRPELLWESIVITVILVGHFPANNEGKDKKRGKEKGEEKRGDRMGGRRGKRHWPQNVGLGPPPEMRLPQKC